MWELIAVNDVIYHAPEQRDLQDVVTCIREGVSVANAGKPAAGQCRAAFEARRRKWRGSFAMRRTRSPPRRNFSTRIDFSLDELK